MTIKLNEINISEQARIQALTDLIHKAIASLKKGLPVIVTDDDDRENEGDFIYLAEKMTPQSMNFLVTEARGLVCVAIDESIADRLQFSMMVKNNEDLHGTAFTVSVDHIDTTTGISAYERALTVNKIASPNAVATDFRRPGHLFPLIAKEGGVLKRRGHTEAAVDLAKLAGAAPAGVICEILKSNGEMARRDDLIEIAKQHDLVMLSIEELVQYRQIYDNQLIKRVAKVKLPSLTLNVSTDPNKSINNLSIDDNTHHFNLYGYQNELDNQEHVALVSGDLTKIPTPLVRIHSECLTGDVFGSLRCDCGPQLNLAKQMIAKEGGVILYMRQEGRGIGLLNKLKAYELQEQGADTVEANHQLGFEADLRRYELCALMLKDLGVTKIRLLTNNPEKINALAKLGIEVIERVPLVAGLDKENANYMATKKNKMSHLLEK